MYKVEEEGKLMKNILVRILLVIFLSIFGISIATAHTIGGAYAEQISCVWGQFGYDYGYIGTYKVNGQIISQFFGNTYCPY